jgi:hypothetical protein
MDDPYFDAPATSDELVTVATYDDAVSARMALNHLCEAGLAAVLSDESTVAMDWLLSNAIGGIKVQVHAKDLAIAHQLLEEHHRHDSASDGAPEPAVPAEEVGDASVDAEAPWDNAGEVGSEDDGDEDDSDIEEEAPLTARERNGLRALRGALLGILFPPIEFYVAYLVYKVFVSEERLGARHRNMACAAAIVMLIVLGGCYALLRPR